MSGTLKRHFMPVIAAAVLLLVPTAQGAALEGASISGITRPSQDIVLSLEVAGIAQVIHVEEGDTVSAGEKILELNNDLENLEARRRKLIWESRVELESARERARVSRGMYESAKTLYEKTRSVSREELDKRELEYTLAEAEADRLAVVEKREELEYRMAVQTIERRILRSPVDGMVIKRVVDQGEMVEGGKPLVRVVNIGRCHFVCNMEEAPGRDLSVGQEVDLSIKAGNGNVNKAGTVVFVSPVVDSASGLLEVKVEFDNSDGGVRPGVSGTMSL